MICEVGDSFVLMWYFVLCGGVVGVGVLFGSVECFVVDYFCNCFGLFG